MPDFKPGDRVLVEATISGRTVYERNGAVQLHARIGQYEIPVQAGWVHPSAVAAAPPDLYDRIETWLKYFYAKAAAGVRVGE